MTSNSRTAILVMAAVAIMMSAALIGAVAISNCNNSSDTQDSNSNYTARYGSLLADSDSSNVTVRTVTVPVMEKTAEAARERADYESTTAAETTTGDVIDEAMEECAAEADCEIYYYCQDCGRAYLVTPGEALFEEDGDLIFTAEESEAYFFEQLEILNTMDFACVSCVAYEFPEEFIGYEQYFACESCGAMILIMPGMEFWYADNLLYTEEETLAMYEAAMAEASAPELTECLEQSIATSIFQTDSELGLKNFVEQKITVVSEDCCDK